MKASLALFSLLTVFTSYSLKSPAVPPTVVQIQANTNLAIADGARQQIGSTLFYDPAYVQLTYPGGDVPQERGVCSDVVIRALRSQKVDLQKLVHEDMAKNFAAYPQKWQLKRPDSNIDHRRVPNLETWFTRHDKTRPTSKNPSDYQAGDIVYSLMKYSWPSGSPPPKTMPPPVIRIYSSSRLTKSISSRAL